MVGGAASSSGVVGGAALSSGVVGGAASSSGVVGGAASSSGVVGGAVTWGLPLVFLWFHSGTTPHLYDTPHRSSVHTACGN